MGININNFHLKKKYFKKIMNKLYFLATLPFFIYLFSYNINTTQNNLRNYSYTYSMVPRVIEDNHYYLYYYNKIDEKLLNNSNILINVNYLSKLQKDKWTIFKSIVDYAYHKNVFIWIQSTTRNNIANEYKFYNQIRDLNYTNVGISLATNNKDIHQKIDYVLSRNGSIRLIYGYYLGNIKDWDIINENYRISAGRLINSCDRISAGRLINSCDRISAGRLINSCCNHILSTEDIDLLEYLNNSYINFSKINLSFNSRYFHRISDKIEKFSNSKNLEIFEGNYLYNSFEYFWHLSLYNFFLGRIY
jgi:hypothetical protein